MIGQLFNPRFVDIALLAGLHGLAFPASLNDYFVEKNQEKTAIGLYYEQHDSSTVFVRFD